MGKKENTFIHMSDTTADVRMVQNRPHVHLETLAHVTKTPVETWKKLLMDPDQPSVHFARTQDGLFVEESSATVLVRLNLGPALVQRWESFWNRTGRTRRRLTESEKKTVAASQTYECGHCQQFLRDTYEVDHIEPHCLRQNNNYSNLIALCPGCHRRKTMEDLRYGDPCFDANRYATVPCITQYKEGGNVFSAYFFR